MTILTVAMLVVASVSTAHAREKEKSGFSKMVGSFNSSIKSGFSKVTKGISPKQAPAEPSDATSLQVKAKPSAKLYVSAANMHAANGDIKEAEEMYKRAMKISSNDANVLTGYAMLKDKMGSYPDAVAMYEKAAREHPENAAVYNGLGLCHATHGSLDRAYTALDKAVKLEPRESKYRNNIAMVLVEMGRYDDAFAHFKAQYKDSVAHYNLGYLIQKRGDKPNAVKHFAAAVQSDPNLSEARVWYNHLTSTRAAAHQTPGRQIHAPRQPVQQQSQQFAAEPTVGGPVLAAQQQPHHVESTQPPINRPRVWLPRNPGAPTHNQSIARQEATAKEQLYALGSDSAPTQTSSPDNTDPQSMAFRSRPGNATGVNTVRVARQPSIQRLPPIEYSFERTPAPPEPPSSQQSEELQLTAPLSPSPQTPVRAGTQFNRPIYKHPSQMSNPVQPGEAEAPMPGSIVPSSPPTSGTTRAPVVYPLPPVGGYQY